jgi:hypothetical protein
VAGRLEKLNIHNDDTGESLSVLFNPTQYSIEDASKWQEQEVIGHAGELHYTGGDRKKLSMDLFFDSYEAGTDVRLHTSKIANLLITDKDKHRPPVLTITWGQGAPNSATADFPLTCVLQTLKQQFVLFKSDGTPVRATLTCVFLEFVLAELERRENEHHSPDHTKAYVVKAGDTLSGVAGMFYEDPRLWRPIAERNEIDNPRELRAGAVLTIPKIT